MSLTIEDRPSASTKPLEVDLCSLELIASAKDHDLYRITFQIRHNGADLQGSLNVKDDCVFAGLLATYIKHAMHDAFGHLLDALRSKSDEPHRYSGDDDAWTCRLHAEARDPVSRLCKVSFTFKGPRKAKGMLTISSAQLDDQWSALGDARVVARDILRAAHDATRDWRLSHEELQEL